MHHYTEHKAQANPRDKKHISEVFREAELKWIVKSNLSAFSWIAHKATAE